MILALGASDTITQLVGVISGAAVATVAGLGVNALDKRFNLSGYHQQAPRLSPEPEQQQQRTPEQQQQRQIIDDVENGSTPLKSNRQKGNYGEMKMDDYFEDSGYSRISDGRVTDLDAPTQQGIDGVYYNEGPPPKYIVAEAKYNTSRLGTLSDGTRQMSDTWIAGRLERAVGFDRMIDIMATGYDKVLVRIMPGGSIVPTILP